MINPSISPKTKIVHLQRRRSVKSFGFSIRGGKEHGIGVFISEVEPASEAEMQGLKVGDEILRVNGCSLQNCIHKEVLNIFRNNNNLSLLIKRVGLVPVKEHELLDEQPRSSRSLSRSSPPTSPTLSLTSNNKDDELSWKFVDESQDFKKTSLESSPSIGEGIEMKIFIDMEGHSGLGCSICKGPKEKPGLFVQSIKDGGLAQQIGLQVGDQIVQVNSLDFSNVEFQDAVKYLKSQQKLEFLIRKGAARDLFPGESSGYNSSSSSINGDTINEEFTKIKLPAVEEELVQERLLSDKILNVTTEETTEEIIKNETVTEEEVHEMMQSENETVREERKFSETVTQIKRVVTTVDVHQNDVLEESDDDIIEGIRRVAEEEIEKERRDAETQTPTSDVMDETSEEETAAKLLSIKLGNIWKEAAANGHIHPQPPPMPDEPIGLQESREKLSTRIPNKNKSPRNIPFKGVEEMQKRQQHDLLIEEFKRVHKLMSEPDETSNILPPPQGWETDSDFKANSKFPSKMKQITTKTTTKTTEETETEEYTETVTEEPVTSNEVLYIDVGPSSSPGSYKSQKSPQSRSSTPSYITDSKFEIPKPPEFFFPKEKPLVTIGTYQESKKPNKFGFLQNPNVKFVTKRAENGHANEELNSRRARTPDLDTTQNVRMSKFKMDIVNKPQEDVGNEQKSPKFSNGGLHSPKFGLRTTASEQNSPKFGPKVSANGIKVRELSNRILQNGAKIGDNFKLTDWNSKVGNKCNGRSDIVIHNGPKKSMAFIQTNGIDEAERNGFADLERNKVKIQVKSDIPLPNKRSIVTTKTTNPGNISYDDYPIIIEDLPRNESVEVRDFNPLKLFTQSQIAGREVKMYSLPKANAMHIMIEGGYGSHLGGRIIVSDVLEGGELYKQGVINRGDQIMWINGCSMIDITLSQAHGIMRESVKHIQEPLKIIVAKAPNGLFDDVSYF